jgi:hypothetical protein
LSPGFKVIVSAFLSTEYTCLGSTIPDQWHIPVAGIDGEG